MDTNPLKSLSYYETMLRENLIHNTDKLNTLDILSTKQVWIDVLGFSPQKYTSRIGGMIGNILNSSDKWLPLGKQMTGNGKVYRLWVRKGTFTFPKDYTWEPH